MAQPFDPDAYLASKGVAALPQAQESGKFDPDAYLASKEPSGARRAQAGVEGFGQGVALGYLPQLQALAGGLIPDPNAALDAKLRAEGFKVEQPEDTYLSRRDENIKRQSGYAKDMPGAYYGGMAGGAISAVPAIGAGLAKLGVGGAAAAGAGIGAKVAQSAAGGAILGAAQNPGDTEGKIDPIQAGKRIQNAKTGALLGAAGQVAASGAAKTIKVVRGIPNFLRDWAEERGAAATGLYKGEATKAIKADSLGEAGKGLKELGRYVLDNKLVKVGDTIEDITNRSGELKKTLGQKIGDVYDKAVQALKDPSVIRQTKFKPKDLADGFLKTVQRDVSGSPTGIETINAAKRLSANLAQAGKSLDMNEMQTFKSQLDDMIYKADVAFKKSGQQTPGIEAAKAMRGFMKDRIDEALGAIDKAFGMTLGEDIKSLNKHYSMVSKVNSIAKDRLAADMGNNFLSLTDKMAGIGGAGLGAVEGYKHNGMTGALEGAALGSAAALASKGMRTYGRPMMTLGADKASGLLSKLPNMGGAKAEELAGLLSNSRGLIPSAGARRLPNYHGPVGLIGSVDSDRRPAKKDKK